MRIEVISILIFCIFFGALIVYPIILSASLISFEDFVSLLHNELYVRSLINLMIFIGISIPIKLTLALLISGLLSGFSRNPLVKVLSFIFPLPWAIPAMSGALSFRWALDVDYGAVNLILSMIGLPKVPWLLTYPTAMASIIAFHVWKWTPLWILMLLAARQAIPEELYESARIDGASTIATFKNITFPLIRNTFFICLLLSTVWSIGEFEAIWLITLGGPNNSTHTITTFGVRQAFYYGDLKGAIASYLSVLPYVVLVMALILNILRKGGE